MSQMDVSYNIKTMKSCRYTTAYNVILCTILLASFCTEIVAEDSSQHHRMHKENARERNLKSFLMDDGTSVVRYRRGAQDLSQSGSTEEDVQKLIQALKAMEEENKLLKVFVTNQKWKLEKITTDLDGLRKTATETYRKVLMNVDNIQNQERQIWETKSNTVRLEHTVSDMIIKHKQLLDVDKERILQLSELQSTLTELKHEMEESRLTYEFRFLASVDALNETLQQLVVNTSSVTLLQKQVSDLQDEIQQLMYTTAAPVTTNAFSTRVEDALRQISELRENYVAKDELYQQLQNISSIQGVMHNKAAVSTKCSVSVRQEPEDGRTHVRMVMSPPDTENTECT